MLANTVRKVNRPKIGAKKYARINNTLMLRSLSGGRQAAPFFEKAGITKWAPCHSQVGAVLCLTRSPFTNDRAGQSFN